MNSLTLNDHVVIVTGAGKGLGEAVVSGLIEKRLQFPGLKLFLTSRTLSELEALQIKAKSFGVEAEVLAADLATNPVLAIEKCVQRFGRVDTLIHCAGVGRFGDFQSLTRDDLEFVMKTNIEATFLLLQKAFIQMKSQTIQNGLRGQIQVITSVAGEKPFEQSSIYCMSKYAQRGLLEVMRLYAYREQIRILEVKPGAALTPMWGEVTADMTSKMMKPSDVAIPMIDALLLPPSATLETLTIRPLSGDL